MPTQAAGIIHGIFQDLYNSRLYYEGVVCACVWNGKCLRNASELIEKFIVDLIDQAEVWYGLLLHLYTDLCMRT